MLKSLLKPKAWIAKVLLLIVIVGFFASGFSGYLTPIQEFLNSEAMSFKVGDTQFSAYMLVRASIIIILLFWLASIVSDFGEAHLKKLKNVNVSNRALIIKALQILIYFIAFLVAMDLLEIDLTGLAIFSGAIGIGVGIGLQKIASNFISGIILLFEKTVVEDDLIELEDGTSGFVRHTGARYTMIETFENREIMIPNEDFITHRITNWTYSNTLGRIDIQVGVSYKSDIKKAHKLLLEAAKEHPKSSKEVQPVCFLEEYGDSAVMFTLYFWVDNIIEGRKKPKSEVLFSIWDKFEADNIEIPFPQRDVHVKNIGELK
ncbi:MAG: mechanosensitive ion channel [Kordiimonadaceae bacterium]|jgi:small-conductance mechanosensitive channel|nr:mechanosensitive ion channel [Kordiimonadaceae bacterium]